MAASDILLHILYIYIYIPGNILKNTYSGVFASNSICQQPSASFEEHLRMAASDILLYIFYINIYIPENILKSTWSGVFGSKNIVQ